jgi:hypothetical protein
MEDHIDILEYYKKANKAEERKEAFGYFETKYVEQPFENYFIIEEESRFIARNIRFFLPGSIYTYGYPNPITKDVLSYYDRRPMSLILQTFKAKTTGRTILQAINLNFIPETQKVLLLHTYYRFFGRYLLEAERDSDRGLIAQAKNLAKFLKDWTQVNTVFVKQGKIPLTFAVRNYDVSGILNPVMIEMEDWSMIPFFVPRELQGIGPAQVYADYVTAKKNALR